MIFKHYSAVNAKSTNRLPARVWRFGIGGMLLAVGTLINKHSVAASTVIGNQAPQQPLQTQDQQNQENVMDVFQPPLQTTDASGQPLENPTRASSGAPPLPQIFQYGPLQLHPHLDYRLFYGNGIQAAPGQQEDTLVQELSPGLLLDIGPHWALDYTPTIRFYSSDKFKDGVDHAVSLVGNVDYESWRFGLTHSSQFTSAPLVETGSQTDQTTHTTALTASHPFSSKVYGDFSLTQAIDLVSGFSDSYDWSTMDWVNYQFQPRLSAGIGVGGGYTMIKSDNVLSAGTDLDQTYEELQARVNWRATDKISFQLSGGLEDRQFMSANTGDSLNPVFGAAIMYQPFEVTQISLSAGRTVGSSDYYLAAQETETTVVSINLSQRVLRKFKLEVGASYSTTDYNSSGAVVAGADRTDDNVSFNVRLSHPFLRRGTWSVFYQYADNTSSQPGFGFQSNQTGFEISYKF